MAEFYGFIVLILFYCIALAFFIITMIWKRITIALAGGILWIILGLERLTTQGGNLTTLNGAIGLMSLLIGILTAMLPFILKPVKEVPPQLTGSEQLEMRMKKYGNTTNATIIRKPVKPWYEDDE